MFDRGIAQLSFPEKDIFRFRYTEQEDFDDFQMFILESCPAQKGFSLVEKSDGVQLNSGVLIVDINLKHFGIRISNVGGKEIICSAPDFLLLDDACKIARFKLLPSEGIYGLGQDPMANLNQRDRERRMWHQWGSNERSGNAGIPFLMSTNGYGILLNSSWPSRFAIGRAEIAEFSRMGEIMAPAPWKWTEDSTGETDPDTTSILLDGGDLDLFIICRSSFDDILEGYSYLTGRAPLFPKWAYGFIQCKNRYRSQEELLAVAREFRKRHIPCDVLVIDWLWFKEFGDLEWDERHWPDPGSMFEQLSDMGFKVISAQHPFIGENSIKFQKYRDAGFLNKVPEGKRQTFDHSNPQAREGWWAEVKPLFQQGLRGYWTDMGELEEHFPGTISFMGCREKVHNIYSLLWSKGLYEGQRRDFAERVFILARTTYAGMQKFATALWSGDIDASWNVLKSQVVVGQGVCLSGHPYWTTDIGGFLTGFDFTPELFVRWLQWGAFCPIFRTHGTKPENEPWSYGPQIERICREIIKLRYRLLPYIYSCARRITECGRPMMRAMCMDFGDDPVAANRVYQYMFGPSILVVPVLERGKRIQEVYLPKGDWYDFWSDVKYPGNSYIQVAAPLDRIPLFIKGGSIIPMGADIEYVGQKSDEDIMLHIYPGNSALFELYDDDGLTYDYEDGQYSKVVVEYIESDARVIKILPALGEWRDMPLNRNYRIVLHDFDEPSSIEAGNNALISWEYSAEKRRLTVECPNVETEQGIEIRIETRNSKPVLRPSLAELIKLYHDTDMESGGCVSVNLTVELPAGCPELRLIAKLRVPDGWTIRKTDRTAHDVNTYMVSMINQEDVQHAAVSQSTQFTWKVYPCCEALPLVSRGSIDVECMCEGHSVLKTTVPVAWGNGWATSWSLVGCFENWDNGGLDRVYEVEINPDQLEYEDGDLKLMWLKDNEGKYNPFGYVELRRLGVHTKCESINGVAYAKTSVWSPDERDAFIEVAAEQGIKIWVNGEEVFRRDKIVLKTVLPTPVRLKKGWNSILVKTVVFAERPYSGREFGFNFRFVDQNGFIMEDLKYKS